MTSDTTHPVGVVQLAGDPLGLRVESHRTIEIAPRLRDQTLAREGCFEAVPVPGLAANPIVLVEEPGRIGTPIR